MTESLGLVVGKFYPPHKGHKYIIDYAQSCVDHLIVMVIYHDGQVISGELRKNWIETIHPNVEVLLVKDIMDDDNSKAWAEYTIKILGRSPDIVFTSEDYGEPYAEHMGCKHVMVDKHRKNFPISATEVRADPVAYFNFLEPCVKAYLAIRVCVLGAESTGTTTLAQDLAVYYNTVWVPEFGRTYNDGILHLQDRWEESDFVFIADMQNLMEDRMAEKCNKFLICDTNSYTTSFWQNRYMDFISPEVIHTYKDRQYDLYILTADDIPFVQDGTRDGEHMRHKMHLDMLHDLEKNDKNFIVVTGSREDRLNIAINACNSLLIK